MAATLSATSTTQTKNKSAVSETGHAKIIANFQSLITIVTHYGATYNPSKTTLKLTQLNALATTAQANLTDVILKKTAYNNTINDRIIAFKNLKSLSTKLVNALEATNASKEMVKDAKGYNRKMHGKRATTPDAQTNTNKISSAQLSYDQRIQHFAGLLSILQSEISYTPNENELKITTLTAKQTELISKNNAVATAYTTISNSRIARNKTLYDNTTGLANIALEVKKYIKSVYGSTSPEYEQVKSILFIKPKK